MTRARVGGGKGRNRKYRRPHESISKQSDEDRVRVNHEEESFEICDGKKIQCVLGSTKMFERVTFYESTFT